MQSKVEWSLDKWVSNLNEEGFGAGKAKGSSGFSIGK